MEARSISKDKLDTLFVIEIIPYNDPKMMLISIWPTGTQHTHLALCSC